MTDIKKVINGLRCIVNGNYVCNGCKYFIPFTDDPDAGWCDRKELIKDAITLLNEQPEIVRCKDCIHWDKGHTEECGNSDSVCFHNGWCKPDWFCADGERRDDDG